MQWLDALTARALSRELPARDEALAVLASSDDDLLDVVAAAFRVRQRYFGRRVKLNFLVNVKSGMCPEDCFYCSQRLGSGAGVLKYSWLKPDDVLSGRRGGCQRRGEAGLPGRQRPRSRGPRHHPVSEMIGSFKDQHPDVEVCACLGLLTQDQAERLREAGADAYNHNLNTAEAHYGEICTTHGFADRVDTVRQATAAGLSACSGLIAGMGESDADRGRRLRAAGPQPRLVPVNFLIPFDGTPLAGEWNLTPRRCLRIVAMVRFVNPDAEVRLAGGREVHLRSLQPLALHIANSIFLGDYLTSEGQAGLPYSR